MPLCLLSAALALNLWVGYFPTVQTAWNQLTAGPLPDQTDQVTVTAMQKRAQIPPKGTVVPVDISDAASGFRHRGELVYLPPAWFATNPPPRLPTVMMIGGEFNTPADWLRTGDAIKTIDDFAAAHHGNAPVLVFVDSGGAFNNDTECVNGSRGQRRRPSDERRCPLHGLELRRQPGPLELGHRRLVDGRHLRGRPGGDASGHVQRVRGHRRGPRPQFGQQRPDHRAAVRRQRRRLGGVRPDDRHHQARPLYRGGRAGSTSTARRRRPASKNDQAAAANSLCALGAANGIKCAVVSQPGKHDWPFASHAFAAALPWLAGQIGTPDVPPTALPPAATSPSFEQTAAR